MGGSRIKRYCNANPGQLCLHDDDCAGNDTCADIPLKNKGRCSVSHKEKCTGDNECPGDQVCIFKPKVTEAYFGASVSSQLAGHGLDTAVLAGRICSSEPLEYLNPQAEEFITLPGGVFSGIYTRGGVTIPLIETGCALRLSAGADAGVWAMGNGLSLGGLVGGSANGEALCVGGLRGQVTAFGELA
ncbi:MAG: hypothetical protein GY703_24470 [Gammaproteobacteria bacterium]|nr:hypothetical protein [Gammaproteobacteria bacterium]